MLLCAWQTGSPSNDIGGEAESETNPNIIFYYFELKNT